MTTHHRNPHPGISRRNLFGGAAVVAGLASAGTLTSCSSAASAGTTVIDYWLWDALQLPAYSAAADRFTELNPDITIRFTQMGWNDYWTKLTASFVAEAGPDVFTDHLGRYPEFLRLGVLAPLDEYAPIQQISPNQFQPGLQDLWTGRDGKKYGVPKDYDTIAFMYDRNHLDAEGISASDLETLDWNPDDGGSFEELIAYLSVDENGKRGDQEGFDPRRVRTFGLATEPSTDYVGQTTWGPFALSTGWTHTNADTWGTAFNYDDERFQATMDWYFGLVDKGFFPPFGMFGDASPPTAQIQSKRAAVAMAGSWMISTFDRLDGVDLGMFPLPSGPVGHPVSLFNGLGDSISAQCPHKEEAARFIAFLASDEAQKIIGERAQFFPATDAGTSTAIDTYADSGLDVSAFTDRVKNGETSLYPLVERAASVDSIMQTAFDQVWMRRISGSDFTAYNTRVNALYE